MLITSDCIFLFALQNTFTMEANTMNSDQTAPKRLGSQASPQKSRKILYSCTLSVLTVNFFILVQSISN